MKRVKVPYHYQSTDYTCGPSSLKMILEYFGKRESEIRLAHEAHTNKRFGTEHVEMINLARKHGFYCYVHHDSNINTIKHFINSDLPVIINFKNPSDGIEHYAVVIGHSKGQLILNDPWNGKDFKISDKVLNNYWIGLHNTKKWIMVVSKTKVFGYAQKRTLKNNFSEISKKPIISGKQYNPIK